MNQQETSGSQRSAATSSLARISPYPGALAQNQRVTKTLFVEEDEVAVLEYLLRHCQGDVVDRLKGKLTMLNFNIR